MQQIQELPATGYPSVLVPADHVEPVPRRIRAWLAGELVLDTTRALYVWESPAYPQYYVPLGDVRRELLAPEGRTQASSRGKVELYAVSVGKVTRPRAAKVLDDSPLEGLSGTVRFDWGSLDAWFEEDEQVFGHPRSPYVRVDAIRSTQHVRVELEGVLLGESSCPVMLFETGLPTRYYLNRTEVSLDQLIPTSTVTACPYKGTTSAYWSARVGETLHEDIAWAYYFPTAAMLPIAGLVSFYNERVDLSVDARRLRRPATHFSS